MIAPDRTPVDAVPALAPLIRDDSSSSRDICEIDASNKCVAKGNVCTTRTMTSAKAEPYIILRAGRCRNTVMNAVPSSTPGIAQGSQITSEKTDFPGNEFRATNQAIAR